jgi:hypothetical protein
LALPTRAIDLKAVMAVFVACSTQRFTHRKAANSTDSARTSPLEAR